MCFTAEETALIDGIIVSYFAPQSVSEPIRLRYFKTHKHLQEETIDRTDLMNIRSALLFLAPEFRDSVQTGKDAQFASTDCPFRMNGAGSSVEAV